MNLTDAQRRQLGESAEWRELQFAKMNLNSYLGNTQLVDLQFEGLHEALNQLEARVTAFFMTWPHSQGGSDGTIDTDSGAVCIAGGLHDECEGGNASASSEHAATGEAAAASRADTERGGLHAC
jgi:hypothetical protein